MVLHGGRRGRTFRGHRSVAAPAAMAVVAGTLTATVAMPGAAQAATGDGPERITVSNAGTTLSGDVSGPIALSGDGSVAAFILTGPDGNSKVYVRNRSKHQTELLTSTGDTEADGITTAVALSANGSRVVFDSNSDDMAGSDHTGVSRIYLRDPDDDVNYLIPSPDAAGEQQPAYSPAISADGTRLAFTRTDPDGAVIDVVDIDPEVPTGDAVSTATTVATIALPTGSASVRSTLSADGSTVAYYAHDEVHVYDIASHTDVAELPAAFDGRQDPGLPALSADGTKLAYVDAVAAGTSQLLVDRVFIYDLSDANAAPQPVPVAPAGDSTEVLDSPILSADGSMLVTTALRGDGLDTSDPSFAADGGWLVDLSSGSGTVIDTGAGATTHTVSMSAEADTIAFSTDSGDFTEEGAVWGFAIPTPDGAAPVFSAGAALTASNITATSLLLAWPAATGPVAGYRLTRGDDLLTETNASVTELPVTGLTAATLYTFTVEALSPDGTATDSLSLTVNTTDTAAPQFPEGAQLSVSDTATDSLRLSWPAAVDNLAVTGYRVTVDGALVDTIGDDELSDAVTGLDPATVYQVAVTPFDAADNEGAALTAAVTTLANLTVTARTGAEIDLSWDPATNSIPAGFEVDTAPTCDGQMALQPDSTVEGHTARSTGLTSATDLCVQVFARYSDGSTAAWTAPLAVNTTAMAPPIVTFNVPRVLGVSGELYVGSTMQITVTGESGRTATATLWEESSGSGRNAVVPLTETEPGVYTGAYLIDGTFTRFGSIWGTLSDETHSVVGAAADSILFVGGDLALHIDPSADPLPGLTLHLEAEESWNESLDVPITAELNTAVDTLMHLPYGTYDASLRMPDGDVLATSPDLVIEPAGSTSLDLTPQRHTLVQVHLTTPTGGQPGGYTVSVAGPDGVELDSRDVPLGSSDVQFVVPAHLAVTVTARVDDATRPVTSTLTASLTPVIGGNPVTLNVQPLPTATVSATVTGDGGPLPDATVTVTQHVDDRDWTFSAVTDDSGHATIAALAGTARVTASGDLRLLSAIDTTLPAGGTVPVTFDLLPAPDFHLHLHLMTTQAGAAEVEQPLDWRTVVHFNVRLTVGTRSLPILPEVVTAASGGEVVQLCADGAQGGLTSGCATVTLTDSADVDVTVHLTQAGIVTASLADESGATYTGPWTAYAYRVGDDGTLSGATSASGPDGQVSVPMPNSGDHTIVITDSLGRSTGPIAVHVAGSGRADLGTLTLSEQASRDPAAILVSPSPALPGQLLGIRVDLPTTEISQGDQLLLTVPARTTFEPTSPTVGGVPAIATANGDGTWSIPLSMPSTSSLVVRFALTVAPDAAADPAGAASLDSMLRLRRSDGTVTEIGTASAQLAAVDVYGPTVVASPTFTVSGTAPAGAEVTLYAADDVAGHATAGPGGRFSANVTFAEPLSGFGRAVVAAVTIGGVTLRSDPLYVTYDADAVEPIAAVVENAAGSAGSASRAISFDPSHGVASFTQVYVPGYSTRVTLTFADASRISNFRAAVGPNIAAGSCTATTCTATVPTSAATVGDVYVDYDVAGTPIDTATDASHWSAEQLRHNLPAPYNATTFSNYTAGASSIGMNVPGIMEDGTMSFSMSDAVITPTAEQDRLAAAAGVPFYGLTATSPADDELDVTVQVADSWLSAHAELPDGAQPLRAQPTALNTGKALRVLKWVFKGKSIGSAVTTLGLQLVPGNDIDQLHKDEALARAQLDCNPELRDQVLAHIDEVIQDTYIMSGAMDVDNALGLFAEAPIKGLSKVMQFAFDTAIGEGMDLLGGKLIDTGKDDVEAELHNAIKVANCRLLPLPTLELPMRRIASPTYIFDPSGYAYAGVAADRVAGVTATILTAPTPDGPWTPWDADAFGQTSPQLTDANGQYGWDVPTGYYKVTYSKSGYRAAESEVVQVLPERMDLNVDMLATAPPTVTGVTGDSTGATVTFDQWMDVDSVRAHVSARAASQLLDATVAASDAQQAPDGTVLAKTFRLALAAPLPSGSALAVTIDAATLDYAQVPLGKTITQTVTGSSSASGSSGSGQPEGDTTPTTSSSGSSATNGSGAGSATPSGGPESTRDTPDSAPSVLPTAARGKGDGGLAFTGVAAATYLPLGFSLLLAGALLIWAERIRWATRRRGRSH